MSTSITRIYKKYAIYYNQLIVLILRGCRLEIIFLSDPSGHFKVRRRDHQHQRVGVQILINVFFNNLLQIIRRLRVDVVNVHYINPVLFLEILQILDLVDFGLEPLHVQLRVLNLQKLEVFDDVLQEMDAGSAVGNLLCLLQMMKKIPQKKKNTRRIEVKSTSLICSLSSRLLDEIADVFSGSGFISKRIIFF